MFEKLKSQFSSLKRRVVFYKAILMDRRTPLLPKILLGLAVAGLVNPFQVVPVLGILDNVIAVLILVYIGMKFVPKEVYIAHKHLLTKEEVKK